MKKIVTILLSLLILCLPIQAIKKDVVSIIPKPVKLEIGRGEFKFNNQTKIWISEQSEELQKLGDLITSYANQSTGLKLFATAKITRDIPRSLLLLQLKKDFQSKEAYTLEIKPHKITISAGSGAGIFYAIQSLLQLMPINANKNNFSVRCVLIEDSPRFQWRGIHLDVCRHFFPVEFIKKYIDVLASYKMNTFHWHLTEDQGWRIEIKKYPKLTEIGAWRKDEEGKIYGGFYTQDQVREIVAYAKDRYINVVPEIEMPGHSLAALASYPELSCTGGPFEVGNLWGVIEDVYCAGNDKVFDFLQDVLTEVLNLFPGEYIHIGGDEVPKNRWKECPKCQARIKTEGLKDEAELQSCFIQRIEKFLNSKGRKILGWDEILEGGLAPNAAVMSWRGIDGGIAAAKAKHNAVMSPGTHCYFDHYQGLNGEPKAIGGYTNLEKVYSYEPVPAALNDEEAKYIMGAQANVWTEYIETPDHVEYMLLPRMLALSEVVWSPKESRDYNDFSVRIEKHYDILSKKNYNFRVPPPIDESGEYLLTSQRPIELKKPIKNSIVRYTLDGSEPTEKSRTYIKPLKISKTSLLKAKTFLKNGMTSVTTSLTISLIDTTMNGINYKYYEGDWTSVPNFETLIPTKSGKLYHISLSDIKPREDQFGVELDGLIKIVKAGEYTFYLSSDDGSKFYFNNYELINNDGLHGTKDVSAKINLTAGKYPFKILYFEKGGDQSLKLEFESAGISRRLVPASLFYLK
ncbi:MAG: family 20 glycosylhydrolase [Melioribacteraceae bacterium]